MASTKFWLLITALLLLQLSISPTQAQSPEKIFGGFLGMMKKEIEREERRRQRKRRTVERQPLPKTVDLEGRQDSGLRKLPSIQGVRLQDTVSEIQLRRKFGMECSSSSTYRSMRWCSGSSSTQNRRGRFRILTSALIDENDKVRYINRDYTPAFFSRGEMDNDIAGVSSTSRNKPIISSVQSSADGVIAKIAIWGRIDLRELQESDYASLRKNRSPKRGILLDYMGRMYRSAKIGLPVYSLVDGKAFVWVGRHDRQGKGALRFFLIDASFLARRLPNYEAETAAASALVPTQSAGNRDRAVNGSSMKLSPEREKEQQGPNAPTSVEKPYLSQGQSKKSGAGKQRRQPLSNQKLANSWRSFLELRSSANSECARGQTRACHNRAQAVKIARADFLRTYNTAGQPVAFTCSIFFVRQHGIDVVNRGGGRPDQIAPRSYYCITNEIIIWEIKSRERLYISDRVKVVAEMRGKEPKEEADAKIVFYLRKANISLIRDKEENALKRNSGADERERQLAQKSDQLPTQPASSTPNLLIETGNFLTVDDCVDAIVRQQLMSKTGIKLECLALQSKESKPIEILSVEVNRGNCILSRIKFNPMQYPNMSHEVVTRVDKSIGFGEHIAFIISGRQKKSCKVLEVKVHTANGYSIYNIEN